MNHPYRRTRALGRTPTQIENARELRRNPTEVEEIAWQFLRRPQSRGVKFRRQHALGPYVVDFYCPQRRLVVELDGGVHGQQAQVRRDARRDAHLRKMGYRVLRFSNGIIERAPEAFADKVIEAVRSLPEMRGRIVWPLTPTRGETSGPPHPSRRAG